MGYGNTVKDGSGLFLHNLCDTSGRLIVMDTWSVTSEGDSQDNNSDKSFVVPVYSEYELLSAFVTLSTDATVGNRRVVLEMSDSGSVIAQVRAGIVQAASLVRKYMFGAGLPNMSSFLDTDYLSIALPQGIILRDWYTVRIYDNAAISVSGDTLVTRMIFRIRSI